MKKQINYVSKNIESKVLRVKGLEENVFFTLRNENSARVSRTIVNGNPIPGWETDQPVMSGVVFDKNGLPVVMTTWMLDGSHSGVTVVESRSDVAQSRELDLMG